MTGLLLTLLIVSIAAATVAAVGWARAMAEVDDLRGRIRAQKRVIREIAAEAQRLEQIAREGNR